MQYIYVCLQVDVNSMRLFSQLALVTGLVDVLGRYGPNVFGCFITEVNLQRERDCGPVRKLSDSLTWAP